MARPVGKVEKKRVTLMIPTRLLNVIDQAAASVGQTRSTFITLAAAQRMRKWRDPLSGKLMAPEMVKQGRVADSVQVQEAVDLTSVHCWHPAHGSGGVPASECECRVGGPHPNAVHRRNNWERELPDGTFVQWEES